MSRCLPPTFYRRDPVAVARDLLGQRLVRVLDGNRHSGIIVETEAYLGLIDKAAHAYRGKTRRNASMWLAGGHAYVYFIYGMHQCMNVVAGQADEPVAVLIRAIEPVEGLDGMSRRRRTARRVTDLCSGPAKLCQALAIDGSFDGTDLTRSDELFIEQARRQPHPPGSIVATHRIGVEYAQEWACKPLRFYLKGNPHVSQR